MNNPDTATPHKAKRVVTTNETVRIAEFLKLHLKKTEAVDVDKAPLWKFDPEWDDWRIARAISPTLNSNHVSRIRREVFGNLIGDPERDNSITAKRIRHLESINRIQQVQIDWAIRAIRLMAEPLGVTLPPMPFVEDSREPEEHGN